MLSLAPNSIASLRACSSPSIAIMLYMPIQFSMAMAVRPSKPQPSTITRFEESRCPSLTVLCTALFTAMTVSVSRRDSKSRSFTW